MLKRLRELLGAKAAGKGTAGHAEYKIRLAATALLIELTRADRHADPGETESMLEQLRVQFGIDENQLNELLQTSAQSVDAATDLYNYTRLINDRFSYDEKCRLLTAMWTIARADGSIDSHEEHFIRKVQGLIHVAHSDFIKAKQASRSGF